MMPGLRSILARMAAMFRGRELDERIDEELRFHVEMQTKENIKSGMAPEEARRQALLKFGGLESVKEHSRDIHGFPGFDELLRNLRYAGRSLRLRPGFAAVAVVSLALGIGANIAVFSLIHRLILTPLPVRDPQNLQYVFVPGGVSDRLSYAVFEKLRDNFDIFETVFGWTWQSYQLDYENRKRVVHVETVTGNYFDSLGVQPALGRPLLPQDDAIGSAPAVVLSHRLWKDFFGGDEAVVGRTIKLLDVPFEVVGVAPQSFRGLVAEDPPDAYVPYYAQWRLTPQFPPYERVLNFYTMARLKPDVPLPAAQALLRERWPNLNPSQGSSSNTGKKPSAPQLRDGSSGYSRLRMEFSTALYALMGLAAAVFLIACANLVSLLVVRGVERSGETSMRLALGASRRQLIGGWMTESALVAAIGGASGLLLARWISETLLLFVDEKNREWLRFQSGPTVIVLTVALTVAAALLFGLLPAIRASRLGIQSLLKEQSAAVVGRRGRLANVVLAVQVAVALVLVMMASLFTRTLWILNHTQSGIGAYAVAYAQPEFSKIGTPNDSDDASRVTREAMERLRNSPNVAAVTQGYGLPFAKGASAWGRISVPGYTAAPDEENVAFYKWVAPGFFDTLQIPLVRGRDFEERDQPEDVVPKVVIVTERLARHYFPGQDPIGREIQSGSFPPMTIIGVVGDATDKSFRETPRELFYGPTRKNANPPILVRAKPGIEPEVCEAELRAALSSLAPNVPIDSGTLKQALYNSLSRDRLVAQLSAAFGVLGLLLAAVGLYGSAAHFARARRREIGLRIALGAELFDVLRLLLHQNLVVVAAGIGIGLAVAFAAGRVIESLLFGIAATDPVSLAAAALILFLVGVSAGMWPALRASRFDPWRTLRYE